MGISSELDRDSKRCIKAFDLVVGWTTVALVALAD